MGQIYEKASAEANENEVFGFGYAEPNPIFFKYTQKAGAEAEWNGISDSVKLNCSYIQ